MSSNRTEGKMIFQIRDLNKRRWDGRCCICSASAPAPLLQWIMSSAIAERERERCRCKCRENRRISKFPHLSQYMKVKNHNGSWKCCVMKFHNDIYYICMCIDVDVCVVWNFIACDNKMWHVNITAFNQS